MKTEISIVAAMTAATVISRFLPFWIFRGERRTPPFVEFLGRTLPYATIGLLVVYCLKAPVFSLKERLAAGGGPAAEGIPELIAVLTVVFLHRWKKNSLLSIGLGTAVYMVLVQMVF